MKRIILVLIAFGLMCFQLHAASVTGGNLLIQSNNVIYEYRTTGTSVQSFATAYPGGSYPSGEYARDIAYGTNGKIYVYNGTYEAYMSTLIPPASWTHVTYSGFSTANNVSYGGIDVYGTTVFVTDELTGSDTTEQGVIAFDTVTGTKTRFATDIDPIDLTMGLDGYLYVLYPGGSPGGSKIDIYDPSTQGYIATFDLSTILGSTDNRTIAVDYNGDIFVADWYGNVYHISRSTLTVIGGILTQSPDYAHNAIDIDISEDGKIALGLTGGIVFITDTSFSSSTSFNVGSNNIFLEWIPVDTIPDSYTLADQSNVELNSTITSNTLIISGINAATPISILGGKYSINGGTYTNAPGMVNSGGRVTVQVTSSGSYLTMTSAMLTIGGVSDTFSVTTKADMDPDPFTFTDQTDVEVNTTATSNTITVSGIVAATPVSITGGKYAVNGSPTYTTSAGTVNNGDTVTVQLTSSPSYSTTKNATLTIGTVSDTFSVSTKAIVMPDPFAFLDQTNAPLNTLLTSNTITVSGVTSAPISIMGGQYAVNGSPTYTTSAGTVNNGDTVTVQVTSSSNYSSTRSATLSIGGVSGTFSITTLNDTTPDPFTFTDQTNVPLNETITSNAITVSGIDTGVPISITGGQYAINGGFYTGDNGIVNNGDILTVQVTSSASTFTTTEATLTINGVPDTFSVTTIHDTTPGSFIFLDQTNVPLNTLQTSNTITVSGIDTGVPISITGGTYSINGGLFKALNGTVHNGDTVRVQVTSSGNYMTTVNATLTIGGFSDTFSVTTKGNTTPTQFSFADQTNVPLSSLITSAAITVSGISASAVISISGGEYSISGQSYRSTSSLVNNGDTVTIQLYSSGSFSSTTDAKLTIGGVSDTFSVTTLASPDVVPPDQFTLYGESNVPVDTVITSNTITISGTTTGCPISITDGWYSINGAPYTHNSGMVYNGDSVKVQQISSELYATTTNATLTIGGISATFSVTTVAETASSYHGGGSGGGCFIATAAFGSPLERPVEILRIFRDRHLLTNAWGKKFVSWYYTNGPAAARYISDKPLAKAAVRAALYPLIGFSFLLISGYLPFVAVALLMSMLMYIRIRPQKARRDMR